jgi:hypothetical protein
VFNLDERPTVTCSVVLSVNLSTGLEKIMTIRVFALLSQIYTLESPITDLALMSMTCVGEGS